MVNKKINMNFKTDMQMDKKIIVNEFLQLHKNFLKDKNIKGVSERTIQEYNNNLHYFKKWIDFEYQSKYDLY